MRHLFAVVLALLLLAAFGFLIYGAQRLYRRLQRALVVRGYRSPVVLTMSGAVAFALTIGGFFVLAEAVGSDAALLATLGLVLLVPLALTVGVRLLPERRARTAGTRVVRFPYRHASYALYAGAIGAVAASAAFEAQAFLNIAAMLTVAGLTCRQIARRTTLPDASAVLAADPRAPVLYLRPFQQDDGLFVERPRARRQFWTDLGRAIARTPSRRHLTLEEYVKDEVSAIGPWIALGNPLDFVPPDGAARTYVADDDWQANFRSLAARAACCVMVPGLSDQVRWELSTLRALGLQERLFILTPPRRPRSSALARRLTMPARRQRLPAIPWADLAAALREAGYHPSAESPGPGAVVGFDAAGRSRVLTSNAGSAGAIVSAMALGLGRHREAAVRV